MVFKPEQSKECKYCGRLLDVCYAEIGTCTYCLDNMSDDKYDPEFDKIYYKEEYNRDEDYY